jgi:hypothetical protein
VEARLEEETSLRNHMLYELALRGSSGEVFKTTLDQALARPVTRYSGTEIAAVLLALARARPVLNGSDRSRMDSLYWDLVKRLPILQTSAFESLDWAVAAAVLDELMPRLTGQGPLDAPSQVNAAMAGFKDVVAVLQQRRAGKTPFELKDEYDVQDVLYAMLRPVLVDLEREDPTPKDLGSSKKCDLVSRSNSLVIEAKYVRDKRHGTSVFDEIKVDVDSYHTHPACRDLVVFVYDAFGFVRNARQHERDFSGTREVRPGRRLRVTLKICD